MNQASGRIVFFGTSDFAVPILKTLFATQFRPELVVTTPDQPAGRGRKVMSPPVKTTAEHLGIPVFQPVNLKSENWKLKIPACDLFLVASYGKILPTGLLALPRHGALNVHPSLLPRWRGASPIQFTILEGDSETGVTIIQMDEEMDHGPILTNSKLQITNPNIRAPELQSQLAARGAELLLETSPKWLAGEIVPQPQDDAAATYTRVLKREDGHIVWSVPAERIERVIRAFDPWPGTFTFWQHGGDRVRLMIGNAEAVVSTDANPHPGVVLHSADGIEVATGNGILRIRTLTAEGGRHMDVAAFRRGHPEILGAVLS